MLSYFDNIWLFESGLHPDVENKKNNSVSFPTFLIDSLLSLKSVKPPSYTIQCDCVNKPE